MRGRIDRYTFLIPILVPIPNGRHGMGKAGLKEGSFALYTPAKF
jgi:hypothetical protein